MAEFALINLNTQRNAVAEYVQGWQPPEILTWMRRYGAITEPKASDPARLYVFESHIGFKSAFRFTEEGELMIVTSGWLL